MQAASQIESRQLTTELSGETEASQQLSEPPSSEARPRKHLFRSLKRVVKTHKSLFRAFDRAHEKSVAKAIEEMSRAADARAAAEAKAWEEQERAAEQRASVRLQAGQRARLARRKTSTMRSERKQAEEDAFFAAAQAMAAEAQYEAQRHSAAAKMQRRQRGILARHKYDEMRVERMRRDGRDEKLKARMRKLRFALRAYAGAVMATRQLAKDAADRRGRLAAEAQCKVDERRLDILEKADPEARAGEWESLRQSIVQSEMLHVAYGVRHRTRTLYLDALPQQRTWAPRRVGGAAAHESAAMNQFQMDPRDMTPRARPRPTQVASEVRWHNTVPSTLPSLPKAAVRPMSSPFGALPSFSPAPPTAPSRFSSWTPRAATPRLREQGSSQPTESVLHDASAYRRPLGSTMGSTFRIQDLRGER